MQRECADSQKGKCGGFHTRWVLKLHSEVPDLGRPNGLFPLPWQHNLPRFVGYHLSRIRHPLCGTNVREGPQTAASIPIASNTPSAKHPKRFRQALRPVPTKYDIGMATGFQYGYMTIKQSLSGPIGFSRNGSGCHGISG